MSSGFATWVLLGLLISNDSMEDERSEEVGRRSPEVVTGLVVIKAYVGAKTGELDKPS